MSYHIADQPTESSLRNYVVRPSAPLIASMVGGAWLGWPWFAFNAVAMGSPTRKREIGIVVGAFAITAALALILIALVEREIIPVEGIPLRLAILAIATFKLSATYYMQTVQQRTFHIYEYYKGPIRPAQRLTFAARILRGVVIGLIDHPLWVIIVASSAAWIGAARLLGLSTGLWGGVLGVVLGERLVIDRQIEVLLSQAEAQRVLGNDRGAIELAQRALTLDPDHARSHAVLANLLLQARRVPGAVIEIQLALGLDADDEYIHRVAARIRIAQRDLDDAWAHCLLAMQGDRATAAAHVLGAEIQALRGDVDKARELLDQALALEPDSTSALVQLARLELSLGALDASHRWVEQALALDPSHRGAHVMAGRLALQRGDTAAAEHHARFVLGQRATDLDALQLWAAIQSRQSWTLGLWWRWHSWIVLRSDRARIAFLIGSFVAVRLFVIFSDELGFPLVSQIVGLLWFAFCAYTWVAPARFRRMVEESLGTVRLDPEF